MIQDKPLPQAVDIEEAIIGTLLVCPGSINDVMAILKPEMFYNSFLQAAFRCCIDVVQKFGTVDLVTLSNELRKKGQDNPVYLTELTGRVITDQMIEHHAMIVKEKYLLRKYIQAGQELANMAYTEDLADVAAKAEMDILNISGFLHNREPKQLGVLVDEAINIIDKLIKKEISLIGVPSGFTQLDRFTGGFKRAELSIIAGRTSMGKTALALQIAKNTADLNNPVAIFSCEMAAFDQAIRFLSGVSGYSNMELMSGRCDMEHLLTVSEPLLKLGIYIDDTSAISLLELRAKARKMILKFGVKMIIVDYLQLMTGSGQSREQEVSFLSRGLKSLAKDLDIPVIALSQLNRKPDTRADSKPQLSDLRESGAIEQDADIVMLLYRPAYYQIKTAEIAGIERDTEGLMVVHLAKSRNGAIGEIVLKHNPSMTKINDE
jgi:replicative DNA helicase